ncbi:hypothetical protein [Algoriphagus sp. AK58]|uniref:hypothetical protein n=1 Tax=Algoriphagus sp. AK58 TaxID=1406877 RepID=UPI00164F520E|nr:hypothetical protein [Algoriphagus sp. AK58]MBC6365573.1 hypothetical protein [Algoriphagus sp. AK58]
MNSLVVDLIVCGLAYVITVYFIATMTKNALKRGKGNDEGDGGIEKITPPKIDLPPGVIWPSDAPKKSKQPEPVEF